MNKKYKKLTVADLLKRETESGGFGLYEHEVRKPVFWCRYYQEPYLAAKAVDETVVKIANRLKLDSDGLFNFMNSKLGRWAGDEIASVAHNVTRLNSDIEKILEKYIGQFSQKTVTPHEV